MRTKELGHVGVGWFGVEIEGKDERSCLDRVQFVQKFISVKLSLRSGSGRFLKIFEKRVVKRLRVLETL